MTFKGNCAKFGINVDAQNLELLNGTITSQNVRAPWGSVFYVDKKVSASRGGRSWANAFKTIQEAITASNALIDWAESPWLVDNYIFIAPGEYAENLTPAYSCHIIGLGTLGTDTAVEIHPTTGACLAGTGLGLHLKNLRFEVTDANPCLDFGICNNTIIEDCEIVCGVAGTGTHGISTENATHLWVKRCDFQFGGGSGGFSHGIYAAGGADKYFHHCRIEHNNIQGIRNAGTGIYIQNTCTASNAKIDGNVIKIPTTGKGIDDNNGGSLCCNNIISVAGAGDAIEHAGGVNMVINNRVCVNGVAALEN